MRERCIHRKVCRYARANTECCDGIVVVHLAGCDVSERCVDYDAERTCRNVSQPSKDGAMFECSECGVTWHAMRYEMGVWLHENPAFCPACGAKAVKE